MSVRSQMTRTVGAFLVLSAALTPTLSAQVQKELRSFVGKSFGMQSTRKDVTVSLGHAHHLR